MMRIAAARGPACDRHWKTASPIAGQGSPSSSAGRISLAPVPAAASPRGLRVLSRRPPVRERVSSAGGGRGYRPGNCPGLRPSAFFIGWGGNGGNDNDNDNNDDKKSEKSGGCGIRGEAESLEQDEPWGHDVKEQSDEALARRRRMEARGEDSYEYGGYESSVSGSIASSTFEGNGAFGYDSDVSRTMDDDSMSWDTMLSGTMEQQQPQKRRIPELKAQQHKRGFLSPRAAAYKELLHEVLADLRKLASQQLQRLLRPGSRGESRLGSAGSSEDGLMQEVKRYPGLDRLKYKLERAIWSDVSGQYTLLLVTVTSIAFLGGAIYASVTGEDLPESLWHAQLFVLDSGSVGEVKDPSGRLVGLVLTVVGLLLVSVLVGIVSQTIERQVAAVTSQITRVLETDHIVVLHWNSSAQRLVRELQMGNRDVEHNLRNNTVVVLAEESREVMTEACRDVVIPEVDAAGGASGASGDVLCMEGSPLMVSSLEMISACRARTIIILAPNEPTDLSVSLQGDDADASALCTMLALTSLAAQMDVTLPRVIMEVHSAETVGLVRRTFGDTVYPILVGAIAAKMTVQAILMPGISRVFRNLLSFQGSEFYFLPIPDTLAGAEYGELSRVVKRGIPVGLWSSTSGLELLPRASQTLNINDRIVLLQPTSRTTMGFDASRASVDFVSMDESMDLITDPFFSQKPTAGETTWVEFPSAPSTSLPIDALPAVRTKQSTAKAMDMLFSSLDLDIDLGLGKADPDNRNGNGSKGSDVAGAVTGGPLLTGGILIAGWRPGMGRIVKTLDNVMQFGSEVHILAEVPLSERNALLAADGLDLDYIFNVKIMHFVGRPGVVTNLRELPVPEQGYTAAALLADWSPGSGTRNLDAIRIKSALLLRDFLWRRMKLNRKSFSADNFTYFVTEVSGAGTDISLPISEFVEVGALDVLAISQVVFQPALHELQIQLLNTGEGVHLTLEAASNYCKPGEILSFKEMSKRVQNLSRGLSLAIGYKVDQDVFINPPRKANVMWEEHHELIMLNRVRKRTQEKDRQKELARKQRRRRKMLQKALGNNGSFSPSFESATLEEQPRRHGR